MADLHFFLQRKKFPKEDAEIILPKTCLMWPSKRSQKYGQIWQVVTKTGLINYNEMHREGKLKFKSHNKSYCLIDVITKL